MFLARHLTARAVGQAAHLLHDAPGPNLATAGGDARSEDVDFDLVTVSLDPPPLVIQRRELGGRRGAVAEQTDGETRGLVATLDLVGDDPHPMLAAASPAVPAAAANHAP